jgi:TolB protein
MKKFLFLFLALAAPLLAQRDIGRIDVAYDSRMIPVRVSGSTPEVNALALQMFGAHGRYRLVASGYTYDIHFALVSGTQVEVTVTRGLDAAPVLSQTATGTNWRNALFRAGDIAVERTNGLGLKGFFAAKIACIGLRTGHKEVYVGDLFFGGVRQITNDRAIAMKPRWSPDGTKIIYTSFYRSGFPDIFLIDLASNVRTSFVSFRGTNSGARFSPSGSQVAMVLSGEGNTEIYVSNAQGHAVSRKTHSDSVKASPCWSPDGSRIVFAAGLPSPQLYIIPASGGYPQRLTYNISGYCAEPDWSIGNPAHIAFTMKIGGSYQIAVYDFATQRSEQVSKAPFDGIEPSWLPDGRHLVYTAWSARTSRLCILDTVTGKSTPISPLSFGLALQASVSR